MIQLNVVENGNPEQYIRLVSELMRGSRATRETINKLCNSILPQPLVELLWQGNIEEIDKLSNIGARWAEALLEQAKANPEIVYNIEVATVEDLLEISFKVGHGEYRPLKKLSTGQKATVIVLLSMVEGKHPIIFDQPETSDQRPVTFRQ